MQQINKPGRSHILLVCLYTGCLSNFITRLIAIHVWIVLSVLELQEICYMETRGNSGVILPTIPAKLWQGSVTSPHDCQWYKQLPRCRWANCDTVGYNLLMLATKAVSKVFLLLAVDAASVSPDEKECGVSHLNSTNPILLHVKGANKLCY